MSLLEDPPRGNSEDFTQEDVEKAIVTTSSEDFLGRFMRNVRGSIAPKFSVLSHELRRWDDHMYCRVRLGAPGEPDKVLIYQIDWVEP